MDFSREERLALLVISLVVVSGLGFIAWRNFSTPGVSEETLLVIQVDGAVNSPGIYGSQIRNSVLKLWNWQGELKRMLRLKT